MLYRESKYNLWEKLNNENVCFNAYSKAIVSLEDREYEDMIKHISDGSIDVDDPVYSELIKQGIIIDNSIDETKLLKFKYNINYYSQHYLMIIWLPTYNCNFDCPYCFEKDYSEKANMKLGLKGLESLKNYARKYFLTKEWVHISLFGGEPLLEYSKIKEYFDFIFELNKNNKMKFSCSITTNGYLLNDQIIDELINKYNLNHIQVTFEGSKKSHYELRSLKNGGDTFDKLISNFKLLIKESKENVKVKPVLRVNLSNHTLKDLNEILSNFNDDDKLYFELLLRPVHNIENFKMDNTNSDRTNLEHFFSFAQRKGFKTLKTINKSLYCEGDGALNNIHILPDLSVWKCISNINNEEGYIGNIEEDGSLKIDLVKIEKYCRNSPFEDEKCVNCKFLPLCFGGCPLPFLKDGARKCYYEKGFSIKNLFFLDFE